MRITTNKSVAFLVVLLFAIGIFFSLYKLTESPPVWYDEGMYFQTAANLATENIDGMRLSPLTIFHLPSLTVGYPLIYPLALFFKVFGVGIIPARSLMVLFTMGLLVSAYFLAKKLFGDYIALGALALTSTFPPLYGNGKSVLGEVPGIFFLTISLLYLFNFNSRQDKERKMFWLILFGVFAGLCAATKPVFVLILPAIFVGMFIEIRRKNLIAKEIAILAISLAAPLFIWFAVQFLAGTSSVEILSFYANPYHADSIITTIFRNVKSLIKDSSTLYTFFIMAVWCVGLFFRNRLKKTILTEEIIAFCFSALIILAYIRVAGVYRYLFYAQIPALIFFSENIKEVCDLIFSRAVNVWKRYIPVALIIILCLLGIYQLMFNSWVTEAYSSEKTAFWQGYFNHISSSTTIFFYDTPEVAMFMHDRNYYQFLLAPAGITTGAEELAVLKQGLPDIVIIGTAKYPELQKGDLFKKYVVDREAYKYSILKKDTSGK